MTNKEKISKIIYDYVGCVYCNNCRHCGNEEDICEWCNRKAMEWELSEGYAEKIADAIVEALEQYQCCGNCTYHNDGDYWCSERNLSTDDDMHCSDWSEDFALAFNKNRVKFTEDAVNEVCQIHEDWSDEE